MSQRTRRAASALIPLSVIVMSGAVSALPAQADSPDFPGARFASGSGNILYLAAGIGLPLLRDGHGGRNHAVRAADALGTSVLLAEGLKFIVREKRPDGSSRDSFPSGHATAAFAVATMESQWHPREAPLWYLGAAVISASRVATDRHYTQDVIAGAALGYFTARLELSRPRGLILSPLLAPSQQMIGLQLTRAL